MANNDRIRLPSSGAGITSYFDDYKSKFQIKPSHVLVMIAIVVLIELFLHLKGAAIFGL